MIIIAAFDVKDQLEKRPKFHTRLRRYRSPIQPGKESKGSKALRAAVAVGERPGTSPGRCQRDHRLIARQLRDSRHFEGGVQAPPIVTNRAMVPRSFLT
jgi:hypothetical protein